MDHDEAIAMLNKEMGQIGNLNDYGANISAGVLNSMVGLKDPATGFALEAVTLTNSHNLSVLFDELLKAFKKINNTKLGLIEITTVTSTVPTREGELMKVDASAEYYIPNGNLVSKATTNGN